MASKFKTMIMCFLIINGTLFINSTAAPRRHLQPHKMKLQMDLNCYKNMKVECQNAAFEVLCQDYHTPIGSRLSSDCCYELLNNPSASCLNEGLVYEAANRCKLDKSSVSQKSYQIGLHCGDGSFPMLQI